jgi:hypothetical protein
MRQWDVCRLRTAPRRKGQPALVLILQSDLLDEFGTRVTAPIVSLADLPEVQRLRPEVVIDGVTMRLVMDRLSVLRTQDIGAVVATLRDREYDLRRALDLVFIGV